MNTIDWVFLTELLVVAGFWALLCTWNSQFDNKNKMEKSAQDIIFRKYDKDL